MYARLCLLLQVESRDTNGCPSQLLVAIPDVQNVLEILCFVNIRLVFIENDLFIS